MKIVILSLLTVAVAAQTKFYTYTSKTDVSTYGDIDTAQKAVEDAEANYAVAKTAYETLGAPPYTLQDLSTDTSIHQDDEGNYYPTFLKFLAYYGKDDYADLIVTGALDGTKPDLLTGVSGMDAQTEEARIQLIKKGTAYVNVLMAVASGVERALELCEGNKAGSLAALDQAVAMYTGNKASTDVGASKLVFGLAQKRAANFGTLDGDVAVVNKELFVEFNALQSKIDGGMCSDGESNGATILKKIFLGVTQGTLRYAWLQSSYADNAGNQEAGSKAEAEGTIFALAMLPLLSACNGADAAAVYEELRLNNAAAVNFDKVRGIFDDNFSCLGFTCEDIGNLQESDGDAFAGYPACGDEGDECARSLFGDECK